MGLFSKPIPPMSAEMAAGCRTLQEAAAMQAHWETLVKGERRKEQERRDAKAASDFNYQMFGLRG